MEDISEILYEACSDKKIDVARAILSTVRKFKRSDYPLSIIRDVCSAGSIELYQLALQKMPTTYITSTLWDNALYGACYSGNMDLIKIIPSTEYDFGLEGACLGGHLEAAQYMILQGATDFDTGLKWACFKDNVELAQYMISQGATDWHPGIESAAAYGYLDIAKLLYGMIVYDDSIHEAIILASQEGHLDVAELLLTL